MVMSVEIGTLFSSAPLRDLSPGETLFRMGQPVVTVFLVRVGRVHLRRLTPGGAEMILQNAGPGAILAEASVYSPNYHCDAIAAEETRVGGIPKAAFITALSQSPELAQNWTETLARSVQAARMRAEIRSLPKVADRLDAWLDAGNVLPERGQWQAVAAELGVTREALYRELSRRRSEGRNK